MTYAHTPTTRQTPRAPTAQPAHGAPQAHTPTSDPIDALSAAIDRLAGISAMLEARAQGRRPPRPAHGAQQTTPSALK